MIRLALEMLAHDRPKYAGLVFGITFAAFMVVFAASYFAGFMTRGLALIEENPDFDVWVMDPAVTSVEQTINMRESALAEVRSVEGVRFAVPLSLGSTEARFANGSFQTFQVIGVDDGSLAGAPTRFVTGGPAGALRTPDAAIVDPGGTSGRLQTPSLGADQWPYGAPHLDAPSRVLAPGDELMVNGHLVRIVGRSETLPRYPPRPLLYTTMTNVTRILPPQPSRLTFVLARAAPGVDVRQLASGIEARTGLRARATSDFETDTFRWVFTTSEDVGDIVTMLALATLVGFGVTAVMLYMFTSDSLEQYAVLKAMGTTPRQIRLMVFAQAGAVALIGAGLGVGIGAVAGQIASASGYPFRLMWYTPLLGILMVALVSVGAAALSVRPALKLPPAVVFSAGRG